MRLGNLRVCLEKILDTSSAEEEGGEEEERGRRKYLDIDHTSTNRVFSCDVITFGVIQETPAMLVYNEIGASMAIFTK